MRVKQINLRKLWLSLLLLVGATAIAIPGIQEVAADGDVAKVGEQGYETLQAAFYAAQDGETVTLLENINLTEGVTNTGNAVLDLNGKDITGAVNGKLITNSGTLTIQGTGHIYNQDISAQGHDAIYNTGTLTINGGIYGDADDDQNNANALNRGAAIRNYGGTTTINGGSFTACDNFTNGGYAYALINDNGGTMTINDAAVYGKNNGNIANNFGTVTIKDGTYTLNNAGSYYSLYIDGEDGVAKTIVEGGTFNNTSNNGLLHTDDANNASLEIKGGSFTYNKLTNQANPNVAVSGGTFSSTIPEAFCADGCTLIENGNGTYSVSSPSYVAQIGTDKYTTLQAAFNAAQNGETVELLKDYDATGEEMAGGTRQFVIKKSITFDGGGYTLTTKQRGIGVGNVNGDVAANIDVTIKNVTVLNTSDGARCIDTRGKVGSLTLEGVTLSTDGAPSGYTQPLTIGGNQSDAAIVTISNSTIQTNDDATAYYAIITFNPVNMTVTNSTIKGWACIYAKGPDGSAGSAGSVFTVKDNSTLVSKNAYSGETNGFSAIMIEDNNVTVNIENTELNLYNTGDQVQSVAGYSSTTYSTTGGVSLGEGTVLNVENTGTGSIEIATNDVAVVGGNSGVIVSGGTYDIPIPDKNCAEGYIPTDLGNGKYGVKEGTYVAEIVGGAKYESLQAAINAAAEGNTVTLLTDINMGATAVNIDKGITIDGDSHTITSTANAAVEVSGTGNVTISNTKINATNGRGIQVGNVAHYSGQLTINEGSVITVAKRGINILDVDQGFALNVDGSIIQTNVADPTTTYTTGEDSRGINFSNDPLAFTANITDSEIRGFSYCTNIYSGTENLTLNISGGKTYGRDVVNNWGKNNTFNLDGVEVHGLNNQTGPTEAFACIVENTGSANNNYNINDCQFIATLSDAAINTANSSASEYMIDLRGNNTKVVITGNTSYTTNAPEKGGFIENEPYIDNNTIMMDETAANTFANAFEEYKVVETEEAPGYTVNKKDYVAQINNVKYESLAKAVEAAQANDVITMIADDNVSLTTAGSEITINKSLTITGATAANGEPLYTISGKSDGTSSNDIFITGSGTVTLSNLKIKNFGNNAATDAAHAPVYVSTNFTGNVKLENVYISDFNRGGIFLYGGTFDVDGCYIDCANSKSGAFTKGIEIKGSANGTIQNTVICNMERSNATYSTAGIEIYGNGSILVDNCTIISDNGTHQSVKGTYGIVSSRVGAHDPSGGSLQVKDCMFNCTNACLSIADDDTYGPVNNYSITVDGCDFDNYIATWSASSSITINSGSYSEDVYADAGSIIIKGGEFSSFAPDTGENGSIEISGGVFDKPVPEKYCAEGFIPAVNTNAETLGDYPYSVKAGAYVAQIGEGNTAVKYETLEAAIEAATTGQTITLLADIDTEAQVEVGKQVTLDLNGKTIEYKGSTTLTSGVLMVLRGGDLTVTDSSEGAAGAIKSGTNAYAAIALTKAGETGTETAKLTVNNGNLEGYYYAITGNGSRHGTDITINGGVIRGTAENDNLGIFHPQDGTLTITGGTITGYSSGVEMRAGTLNITGGTLNATAETYSYAASGSGNTTVGAAVAIAPHKTGKDITANITGADLSGNKLISVVDAQSNNLENVKVTANDDYIENTAIPADFKWVAAQTEGMSTLAKKTYVAQIGDDKYESLAAAVAAVPTDGTETTITMIADENINNNAGVTIASGKNIILDLNGKSIVQTAPEAKTAATITNKGTLTIEDNAGGGSISMTGTPDANWLYGIWVIDNRNKLVINSGTIINNSARGLGFAVHTGAYGTSTTVEVNGGTISHPNYCAFCVYYQQGGSQIVNINGGTITGSASSIWYQICTDNPNIDMTISGGEIISTSDQYAPIYVWAYNSGFDATNVKMAIKGGYVNTNGVSDVIDWDDAESAFVNLNKKVISGGKFSVNPDAYVAEGYISTANTDPETKDVYPYTVKAGAYVAQIGEGESAVKYETLQDAINACEAGTETTIKLLDNVTDGAGFAIPDGVTNKNIIIDFDGKSYNVTKDAVGSGNTKTQAMHFYSGNTLTLKNGTITSAATSEENKLKMMMQNYCDLTLDGMTIDCSNVNGGTYPDYSGTAYEYWSNKSVPVFNFNTGNATIKNTTITFRDDDNVGLCVDGGTVALGEGTVVNGPVSAVTGTVTITDGKYSGAVTADQATLKISGGIFAEEPADEYCAKGYVVVDNEDETTKDDYPYTVMSKEDAGIFELIDGQVYPYLDYTEDKPAASVSYFRTFKNTNWMALYIPFDINDVTQLTDKYEFAKVHMVAYETNNGAVVSTKIRLYYIPITSGTIYANMPYLIKLKNQGDANKQQEIKVENTTLYHTQNINDNPLICSTTNADYLFKGTYKLNEVIAKPEDTSTHFFGVGGGGISYISNNTLTSYRWYIKVDPRDIHYAKPTIEFVMGDEDVTGISNINNDDNSEIEGYYTVNGVRSDVPVNGMNIVKYKNGKTKKVMIK